MKKAEKNKGGLIIQGKRKSLFGPFTLLKAIIMLAFPSSASGKVIQGKLGFAKSMRDTDFSSKAKAIFDALTLNTGGYFSTPFADMALFEDMIIAFDASVQNVKLRVLGAGGAQKTAKTDLYGCLKNALAYVNSIAYNRQAVAE